MSTDTEIIWPRTDSMDKNITFQILSFLCILGKNIKFQLFLQLENIKMCQMWPKLAEGIPSILRDVKATLAQPFQASNLLNFCHSADDNSCNLLQVLFNINYWHCASHHELITNSRTLNSAVFLAGFQQQDQRFKCKCLPLIDWVMKLHH